MIMKTLKYLVAVLALIAGVKLFTACTGYVVAAGPPLPPDEIIVAAPSPYHVWVPGYYTYTGGTYIWIQGSYQVPPRGRTRYVQGEWVKTPKGYKHGRGHWNNFADISLEVTGFRLQVSLNLKSEALNFIALAIASPSKYFNIYTLIPDRLSEREL